MTENQFWWATLHGHDRPEVAEVIFDDGQPRQVDLVGTDNYICACDFERCQVRLIERVLPAGRAAAAVEKLERIFMSRHADFMVEYAADAVAILQDGENRA